MSNRSWVRALSASAAIAINRVNYAYLISIIQLGIAPVHHPCLIVADFLILCAIPTTPLVVCSIWPPGCPHLLKFIMAYLVCIRIPLVFYLSPTYFVRSYVCAHTTLYAHHHLPFYLCRHGLYSGFRVPVGCVSLLVSLGSGVIHLLIWGVFFWCQSMHSFSLLVSFAAASQIITDHAC